MESLDDIKQCWNKGKGREHITGILDKRMMNKVISSRIKTEQRTITRYITASGFWQMVVYGFMTHFIIRFWGDWPVMLLSLAGILLYVPFTVIFLRKFKAMCTGGTMKNVAGSTAIYEHVKNQYAQLSGFFRFKKKFDWIGIPLSCFILLVILFKLYVTSGIKANIVGAAIGYAVILIPFVIATHYENKNSFKKPLDKLQGIIRDMESNTST